MLFSAKRSVYSAMPSDANHSAIVDTASPLGVCAIVIEHKDATLRYLNADHVGRSDTLIKVNTALGLDLGASGWRVEIPPQPLCGTPNGACTSMRMSAVGQKRSLAL